MDNGKAIARMDIINKEQSVGAVLVAGGGIGGMQASLDLAESGFYVYLIDPAPVIGGVMSQLDKTFPTNDCAMCIMSPKLVGAGRHLNIRILSNAEIGLVEGGPGRFGVTVTRKPRYISSERCTGCGECAKHCPVSAIDRYNENMSRRPAVYLRYPQGVPKVYLIDRDQCIGCGLCERVCLARAVNYADAPVEERIEVGSIILAPGYETFDARRRPEFGYGVYDNVLTSLEFERLLSATGPHRGHILRPSDGTIPERIAFIQCVGSRDASCGNDYCSSICCMYATKEAIIAKEHVPFIQPTIFYMDIRAHGKGFDAYYERAKADYGVRYVKCMVSRVREQVKTKNLLLSYLNEEGQPAEEEFDLVVLSVGVETSAATRDLARRLGVELDGHGFCKTRTFAPTSTSKPGIYVCGAFEAPKDIPETVAQASGAAAAASEILAPVRGTKVSRKEYPEQQDVNGKEPRIGVFVCHCGINIGGVVDVPAVRAYARTLRNVVYVEENLYTCSQDTQEKMRHTIQEHQLNRVIVASCSPRTHEPLFRETVRESGLNKFLFEMANIRDQCSWVHMRQKNEATEKAKDLVRMAVANARMICPLEELPRPVVKKGLVMGGGAAGMSAALGLAQQGFEVFLVEKENELGGNLRRLQTTLDGMDIPLYLEEMKARVTNHPRIQVFTNSVITDFSGYVGNFKTSLMIGPRMSTREVEHGVAIVATGGEELKPKEYLYGEDNSVLTQLELEDLLHGGPKKIEELKEVVMIQCVGSRNEERPYCSRVCCAGAVKNALKIKERNPRARITILYRDMRTYGLSETYYAKAREAGILFASYDLNSKPMVTKEGGGLQVSYWDRVLKEKMVLRPDLLVLSSAIVPSDTEELSRILKLPRTADGFFLEAHMKLRPVDFASEGIFLCGMAHSPKRIDESLSQAAAAVARACTVLSKQEIHVGGVVGVVDPEKCAACLTCVRVCPYNVPVINRDGVAEIEMAKCQGCGSCAAECPGRAIELMNFRHDQIEAKCEALVLGA